MPRFSERIDEAKPDTALQVDSLSAALRNSLGNLRLELYEDTNDRYWQRIARHIANHFRKMPADF